MGCPSQLLTASLPLHRELGMPLLADAIAGDVGSTQGFEDAREPFTQKSGTNCGERGPG
ncbi:hypothetical protein [Lyngbya confervoides]|uniref:Uncharacterized protein n=1 Tax=Lyngbya confervoides BDU141951 TaxID=1574623 RepID=A0ABD4T6D7_9CYAN|nr:hypothetical protein [Lyngbya confervoides]MCM1984302.1 hypothetical protein [Lyngbya confervoides BDU141951]